jgi:hypothetical protein
MSTPAEFTWLKHVGTEGTPGHEGTWACPSSAVETWAAMGWEPCDPPEEPNPVVAENLAAQRAEADRLAAEEANKSDADTTTFEGN